MVRGHFRNKIWKKPLSQIIRKETRNDHDELKHLSHEKLILSSLPTISFRFSMPILRRDSTLLTNFNFIPFQNWFLTLYIQIEIIILINMHWFEIFSEENYCGRTTKWHTLYGNSGRIGTMRTSGQGLKLQEFLAKKPKPNGR